MGTTQNKNDFDGTWQLLATNGVTDIENRGAPQQPAANIEYFVGPNTPPSEALYGHSLAHGVREPFLLSDTEFLWGRGPTYALLIITADNHL